MPVPRSVVERHGGAVRPGSPWTRPGNLVGNGPFVLKSWQPQANLTVTRSPYYWDRAHVRLNEIRFYGIEESDAEERAFRAGQLHTTYRTPLNKLAVYRGAKSPLLHVTLQLRTNFVVFNTTRPPFDNTLIRRALSLAIDRDGLVSSVLHETGAAAHALTRPGTGGYSPPIMPDFPLNLLAFSPVPHSSNFP